MSKQEVLKALENKDYFRLDGMTFKVSLAPVFFRDTETYQLASDAPNSYLTNPRNHE